MYLTQSHTAQRPVEVHYYPGFDNGPEMQVQVFLGSAHQSLYMTVEEARDFAEKILAAIPAPVTVEA